MGRKAHFTVETSLIYSVTILIEDSLAPQWLEWMRSEHIPDVLATGYFSRHRVLRLKEPQSEPGMVTYNVQYDCDSAQKLTAYLEQEAPRLQKAHNDRFGGSFKAFRTVLEVLT